MSSWFCFQTCRKIWEMDQCCNTSETDSIMNQLRSKKQNPIKHGSPNFSPTPPQRPKFFLTPNPPRRTTRTGCRAFTSLGTASWLPALPGPSSVGGPVGRERYPYVPETVSWNVAGKSPPKKTHETHEKWGFKGLLMIFMVKCLIKRMEVCSWEDHGTKWWIFRCHVWWPEGIPTKQLDARWGVALSFHSGVLTCCNGNVGRGRSPNRDTDTPEGPWTFQILHPPNPSGRGLSS